jgi:cobaltochelatase CobN
LAGLLKEGLAESLPVAAYQAWFDALPESVRQEITARLGKAGTFLYGHHPGREKRFVIRGLLLGHVAITRQPPRGDGSTARKGHLP